MILIKSAADMAAVLKAPPDSTISEILLNHVARLSEYEGYSLEELAHFLVISPGDQLQAVDRALGFELATATPEFVDRHDDWFELVVVISDDGLGWVILIKDEPGVDADLLSICGDHAQVT